MEKKGKVKSVHSEGSYKDSYGLKYKYSILMEDETTGEYSSSKYQNQNDDKFPYKEGQEVDYDFTDGKYPKIKPIFKQSGYNVSQRPDASDAINYHVALKEAVNIVGIDGWGGNEEIGDKMDHLSNIAYALARRSKENIEKLKKH